MNIVHLIDNMEFMAQCKDNQFDLSIVDVPYGSDNIKGGYTSNKGGRGKATPKTYNLSVWKFDKPEKEYFDELMRISKNQIIWGANHFISRMPFDASCWIVWNKLNTGRFADCELAWTSFETAVRMFTFRWNGMLQGDMKHKETRIHPTQKPVALYKWLLQNYAKPGQTIFDSHVGSGSIRIACYDMGFDFEGCEIDKDYWEAQEERFKIHTAQGDLFSGADLQRDTISMQGELLEDID